jgi:hypothetical protein
MTAPSDDAVRDADAWDADGADEEEWEWEDDDSGAASADGYSEEGDGEAEEWEEDDEEGWDWEEEWQEAEEPTRAGKGPAKRASRSASKPKARSTSKTKATKAKAKPKAKARPKRKAQPKARSKSKSRKRAVPEPGDLPLDREQDPLGLGLGLLAALPWVFAYEFSVAHLGDGKRNGGELLLSTPLMPMGEHESTGRWVLLSLAVGWVLWLTRSAPRSLFPRCLRIAGEGLVAAALLGPLLLLVSDALGVPVPGLNDGRGGHIPGLAVVARYSGGAFYEELLFRVMLPSAVFLTALQGASFLGVPERGARSWATGVAWVGASLLFAASHLDGSLTWRGFGGEDWDPALFAWRALAGALLLLLLRLRGLGVAVWAHALFNAALVLGAGPAVFAN